MRISTNTAAGESCRRANYRPNPGQLDKAKVPLPRVWQGRVVSFGSILAIMAVNMKTNKHAILIGRNFNYFLCAKPPPDGPSHGDARPPELSSEWSLCGFFFSTIDVCVSCILLANHIYQSFPSLLFIQLASSTLLCSPPLLSLSLSLSLFFYHFFFHATFNTFF